MNSIYKDQSLDIQSALSEACERKSDLLAMPLTNTAGPTNMSPPSMTSMEPNRQDDLMRMTILQLKVEELTSANKALHTELEKAELGKTQLRQTIAQLQEATCFASGPSSIATSSVAVTSTHANTVNMRPVAGCRVGTPGYDRSRDACLCDSSVRTCKHQKKKKKKKKKATAVSAVSAPGSGSHRRASLPPSGSGAMALSANPSSLSGGGVKKTTVSAKPRPRKYAAGYKTRIPKKEEDDLVKAMKSMIGIGDDYQAGHVSDKPEIAHDQPRGMLADMQGMASEMAATRKKEEEEEKKRKRLGADGQGANSFMGMWNIKGDFGVKVKTEQEP